MDTQVQNTQVLSDAITEKYKNIVVGEVNDHCLRLAVMEDQTFAWHHHPDSDELFMVLEGELTIEFKTEPSAVLHGGDFFTVPRGCVHRTIARGRTVNLCFEARLDNTVFEKVPPLT